MRNLARAIAIWLALVVGLLGIIALSRLEVEATESTRAAADALEQVEWSLRESTELGEATASALDAAATSLDNASATSTATAQVARDVSEVSATLRPVVNGTGEALVQIDATLEQVVSFLDALPFGEFASPTSALDQIAEDIEPLDNDLLQAQQSLTELAQEAEALSPSTAALAVELRGVARELRTSNDELLLLADSVATTSDTVTVVLDAEATRLLPAQLMLAALCAAIILTNVAGWKPKHPGAIE